MLKVKRAFVLILGYFVIHLPQTPSQVPDHVYGGGGEVGHRHPHVGGALLGAHRLVEIAEQVDRVLGVGPGVKGLSPEVVIFVLCDVIHVT